MVQDDPSCMVSSSEETRKAEALYAFRTIATMLSFIQSTRDTADKRPKYNSEKKRLLKLLDAMAAVLIRNNGVIAVTARPYDGSGRVEALASCTMGNGEPSTNSTGKFTNILRNIFISQNPRDLTVKQEEVVDPEMSVPNYLKKISDPTVLLSTFLTRMW